MSRPVPLTAEEEAAALREAQEFVLDGWRFSTLPQRGWRLWLFSRWARLLADEYAMCGAPGAMEDARQQIGSLCGVRWTRAENRRELRARNAVGTATPEQLAARVAFYGGLCWICRSAPYEAIDHVKPLAKGGSHWPANLRPACRSCNSRKGARWPYTPAVA